MDSVLVEGATVDGSYDKDTRVLTIPLSSINKNEMKEVTFKVSGKTVA
ncbi:hypothetical protein HB943_14870 [Listeria weihenstephanensis]|uniref:Uncharacterized protein n=1 Tax=Listeria weihenstephanensis TaxID=1006155 RepID=A0A841Z766_9LIST|nr:hypothetical protein [Listeria weihenstephanensis]